jgi:hypothetical protein
LTYRCYFTVELIIKKIKYGQHYVAHRAHLCGPEHYSFRGNAARKGKENKTIIDYTKVGCFFK